MKSKETDKNWASGGAHPKIVTIGDPSLREIAESVTDFDHAREVVDEMVELLRSLGGAGLAAPQIAYRLRIIVVEVRKTDLFPDRAESPLYTMVNPVVNSISGETNNDWEGCYSVPGIMGKVPRQLDINVTYNTPDKEEVTEDFTGYLARVILHECDHLDGVTFLDRIDDTRTISTVSNWMKHQIQLEKRSGKG